jgi:serine/threonine protein phosphatase PrpC
MSTSTDEPTCPACGSAVQPDDRFCEACGAEIATGIVPAAVPVVANAAPVASSTGVPTAPTRTPCAYCGAPASAIDVDGYCEQCGLRQPRPRDHHEIDAGWAAGVTDRGLRHHQNEDAMYLETVDEGLVAVVCDGVSTSVNPDVASQAAVDAAGAVLLEALKGRVDDLSDATTKAVAAAQAAVLAVPGEREGDISAPSCTFVSAVAQEGRITVGWVGDSRAYWFGPDGQRQLTEDDSWATEQVSAGLMTEHDALQDPNAHAITRWLGEDAPGDGPRLVTIQPEVAGRLLLCSDGLWNYAAEADALGKLLETAPEGASDLAITQALTKFALTAGGHDNITVVVADVHPAKTKEAT